jgi:hypothetical protein
MYTGIAGRDLTDTDMAKSFRLEWDLVLQNLSCHGCLFCFILRREKKYVMATSTIGLVSGSMERSAHAVVRRHGSYCSMNEHG